MVCFLLNNPMMLRPARAQGKGTEVLGEENLYPSEIIEKMKVAVIGGGISGLSVGHKLAERGFEVSLVERETNLGGLCQSIKKDGLIFDLGPHNIHTNNPDIISELGELLGGDLLTKRAKSQIYFRNKFVDYPFKGLSVFTSINPITAVL